MEYVLYSSQLHHLNGNKMYLGQPNFFASKGNVGGIPMIVDTDKLDKMKTFDNYLSAKGFAQTRGLKGYCTIKKETATRLLKEYTKAREKRTDIYKITDKEIQIIKRFESSSEEVPYIWG